MVIVIASEIIMVFSYFTKMLAVIVGANLFLTLYIYIARLCMFLWWIETDPSFSSNSS